MNNNLDRKQDQAEEEFDDGIDRSECVHPTMMGIGNYKFKCTICGDILEIRSLDD